MKFENFPLSEEILKGIEEMGFEEASPIQVNAINPLLEGNDLIAQAQTGTGKTAAFGIPILERVTNEKIIQALVLCPTRELSIQVADELYRIGKFKRGISILSIYGGTSIERQIKSLKKGVQVVVGTPGRIMDLMRRRVLDFSNLKIAVLDEADEMFDMGFRDDMKTILDKTNQERQTCFFSATMGKEITEFSKIYQKDPIRIQIKHKELTVENISQYYLEMKSNMKTEILSRIIDIYNPKQSIVFCNTKRKVDELVLNLSTRGYSVDALHGDLRQGQRDNVMRKFRESITDILVATDVAARGIDVGSVDMVINFDLPQDEEYYVHRIGRTARAGRKGRAFSFVVGRDQYKLNEIKRYTKADIQYMDLPKISDIDAILQENLIEKITRELDNPNDISKYKPTIDSLLLKEYGCVDIATVLLKLISETQDSKNHETLERVDYNVSSGRGDRKTRGKSRKSGPKSRIFVNKGRRDGLSSRDILALLKSANISEKNVGEILIKNNFSFLEVPKESLNTVLKTLNSKKVKGKKIEAEIAEKPKKSR